MANLIQKLAEGGEAAYRTKSAEAFAAWLIPNVLLVLGALKTLAEVERAMNSDPAGSSIGDLLTDAANVLLANGGGPLADRLAAVAAAFYCIEHADDANPQNIALPSGGNND